MDESGPATYHSIDYSRSLGNSYTFLTTLFLSVVGAILLSEIPTCALTHFFHQVGWITSLISQAVVTAQSEILVATLAGSLILSLSW